MRSILLLFLGVISYVCWGQSAQDQNALYLEKVGVTNDPIFIGELDPLIVKSRSTHPFFLSRGWQEINIEFGSVTYEEMPALYDLSRGLLILKYPDASKIFGIIPNMRLVGSFKMNDRRFRRSPINPNGTFYEELYTGVHFNLLVKRTKEEKVDKSEVVYIDVVAYFLENEKDLIPLSKKKDLNAIGDLKTLNALVRAKDKSLKYSRFNEEKLVKYMEAIDEVLSSD